MRAHQFLLEYRRDLTAQSLGPRLIQALANSSPADLPDELHGPQTLAGMAMYPGSYFDKPIKTNILGTMTQISPRTAEEVLEKLKIPVVQAILQQIESKDYTANKQYVPWLARSWANGGGRTRLEDLNRNNLLALFDQAKRRRMLKPQHTDVNRFQTWNDFENVMLDDYDLPTKLGEPQSAQARGQAREVYRDSTVRVIQPLDEQAACYYGQGTRWCTAATRGQNYFDRYNQRGPMYIFLPTEAAYPGEKYQISFASAQYMNEQDEEVSPLDIFRRFPDSLEWFKQNVPEIKYLIMFADDDVLSGIWGKIIELAQELALDKITEWEQQDDSYWQYQTEFAEEHGYVDSDGDVDWEQVQNDPKFVNYLDYDDNVRQPYQELQNLRNVSPGDLKIMADHYAQDEGEDLQIPGLEDLFIKLNYNNQDPFDINDDLSHGLYITPKDKIPQPNASGKTIREFQPYAQVGDYAIGWMRYRKK